MSQLNLIESLRWYIVNDEKILNEEQLIEEQEQEDNPSSEEQETTSFVEEQETVPPKEMQEDVLSLEEQSEEVNSVEEQELVPSAEIEEGASSTEESPEDATIVDEQEPNISEEEQVYISVSEGQNEEATVDKAAEIVQYEHEVDVDVVKPYHEDYYLLYGNKEKKYLDLEGTKKLLQKLGFDGGELKQAREGKETSQAYKADEEVNSNKMYCSYCGLEISGVEYQRLPDGRLRCTSCSNSLVKSEMQELCDRVKTNMEAFFSISINMPIHIEVVEERKLKKKIKRPLSEVDDQSILVLGAAVNDKKGYRIYLENGAPRISVIATFAHELTHIWQYVNWNKKKGFKKCSKARKLLIYEGMAKWVEIQYLYLTGETAVARREEFITRQRQDEYGIGFRMVEDKYPLSHDTIVCDDAPFTKDEYPID